MCGIGAEHVWPPDERGQVFLLSGVADAILVEERYRAAVITETRRGRTNSSRRSARMARDSG